MDSFHEPYIRQGDDITIEQVRAQLSALEASHKQHGIQLSGRVLHVCHYLPTLPSDADDTPRWSLSPRYGHAAMISGIRSLSFTYQQLIIGWTGDILSSTPASSLPASSVSSQDRAALEDALATYTPREADPDDDRKTTYVPVWLDQAVAHGHYDGYCKQSTSLLPSSLSYLSHHSLQPALWPLFHYLLWQDVATEYASADSHYSAYAAANLAFAQRIAQIYVPGDLIWVHDYHLLLVPKMLRALIPDAVIGLFVHTPFPSSEVFRCLPRRKEILDGMLGANLVCFQTYSYSRHFTSTCVRVCGYESTSRKTEALIQGIDVQGHVTSVMHCPVGVDAERVARDTLRPGVQPKLEALRSLYEGKKIIMGRDKLDVVKGVLQKLRAFEKLLHDYPEWIGQVVLIQVTSPALSDSPKLERQVSELVAHINGEYGSLDFIPVHHYHQTLKKDEFYALLSVADLGVITPLRDGMNTTSMEFVIAQEKSGKRSPLVLSEFMGISQHMADALLVNPWDLGDVASAMNRGLLMSASSKLARHERLHRVVTTHTSHTWALVLSKMLLAQMGGQGTARRTPFIEKAVLKDAYDKAGKRLFLFDYDGTLTPIVKTPAMAVPSPSTLLALTKLTEDPKNLVYIVSGRDQLFLEQHLGKLSGLGMSAEHGGFIREPMRGGSEEGGEGKESEWVNFTERLDMEWMEEVGEVFRYYTERTTGSHIEVKKSSITWHYRASDPEWGQFQCRQCQDLLENNLAHKRPIEVLVGKKNLEVRPIAVNKGEIVKRILYQNPDADFIFCAGDDKTDEDMFRALHLFATDATSATLDPPLSITLIDDHAANGGSSKPELPTVALAVKPEGVFTTAVGHMSKRTLASWHVTTPEEVVGHMLHLVDIDPATVASAPLEDEAGEEKETSHF
ncbi:glycosyltransferase family 20 protein [Serpula lacrymans var. lacrymans S7.9]|uniref:Glycosyltransferase family 20 protein n=1 Tax=Serpula lacrymans var. lacrymans (strain S7.9) TaxID=578457 RepID=F8NJG0_SERL9|nr:glycosyltransferase family 20 protein [Serpula lacrymans var. lacrymans S7.9]EGO29858.1 glycosyltransferase family 20 protein [Serpula lacrymans var. lacrymans S7.9]